MIIALLACVQPLLSAARESSFAVERQYLYADNFMRVVHYSENCSQCKAFLIICGACRMFNALIFALQLIVAETVTNMHIANMVIVFVIQGSMAQDMEETARNLLKVSF